MRSWLVLMVLAAGSWVGCWKEQAAEPRPLSIAAMERPPEVWPSSARLGVSRRDPDRCAQAINHVFEVGRQDAQISGFTPAMIDDIQELMIESCHETSWSDESLGCYESASSMEGAAECFRSMTAEQREDFDKRFKEIRQRHRNLAQPVVPPTP